MDISTKANIGDTVFFMSGNKVTTGQVKYIRIEIREVPIPLGFKNQVTIVNHISNNYRILEQDVFLTKQELLDSL